MKFIRKKGGAILVAVILLWALDVHWVAFRKGQPLPALQWAQVRLADLSRVLGPLLDRLGLMSNKAKAKAPGAIADGIGKATDGGFRLTAGGKLALTFLAAALVVLLIVKVSQPSGKNTKNRTRSSR